jgi:hypothetical protein
MSLWQDKHKTLRGRFGLGVDGDLAFNLHQRGLFDERTRLGVDGVGGEGISNRGNGLGLFSFFRFIKFDISLQ